MKSFLKIAVILKVCLFVNAAFGQLNEDAKIQSSDIENFDWFGFSVAASGDRAIIGAPNEDEGASSAGAAYIFERGASGDWLQIAKIRANIGVFAADFGDAVGLSGNYAIVSAKGEGSGTVYIFERDANDEWNQAARLQSSDTQSGDDFGESVAISGNLAIVGADNEDTGGSNAGAAYIFERDASGAWSETAKIQASDKQSLDLFGFSVDIDGNRAIIGSILEDDGGASAGAAYIFERDANGSWSETAKILASDREVNDQFGRSVALQGGRAVVGAIFEDTGGANAGAAYVFEQNANGVWNETAKIQASDKQAQDRFGGSVALSGDRVVVGANEADAAYIFERNSDGSGWSEVAKFEASNKQSGDEFGHAVAVSGNFALVGAYREDTGGDDAGSGYFFSLPGPILQADADIEGLIDDPVTPLDALEPLQEAQDALNEAEIAEEAGDIEEMLNALRDAANALEEAREEMDCTDAIASSLANMARDIATAKKAEALDCDPTPSGKMADDMEDGDNDLADGDEEYADGYFGDAIKDYRKAWEDYCSALERCEGGTKAALGDLESALEGALPAEFALHQNYPNPFNPSTTIQFDLAEKGHVELNIYNSAGQLVRALASGDFAPGAHKVVWDAKDDSGSRVASGVYLYTIKVGQQFSAQKKLLLMK